MQIDCITACFTHVLLGLLNVMHYNNTVLK